MKDIQIHNNLNAFSQHLSASKGKLILICGDADMGKTALMFSVILQSPQNMHFIQAFGQDKESITRHFFKLNACLEKMQTPPYTTNNLLNYLKVAVGKPLNVENPKEENPFSFNHDNLPDVCFVDDFPPAEKTGPSLKSLCEF